VVLLYPHFWHSKVQLPWPDDPGSNFDSSIRCCRQFWQAGRLIAAMSGEETGLNSGMIHRACLAALENSFSPKWPQGRTQTKSCPVRYPAPCSKLLSSKKLLREGVNKPAGDPRHCN